MTHAMEAGLVAAVMMVGAAFARAEAVLLDGDTAAGLEAWSSVERVAAEQRPFLPMAGSGSGHIRVVERQSAQNAPERQHARLATPSVTDWKTYERLVMDVFNDSLDSLAATVLRIEFSTMRNEAQLHVALPPDRRQHLEWPSAEMDPELADIGRVRDVQLSIDRQTRVMDAYVDSMVLLGPGEKPPPPALHASPRPALGGDLREVRVDYGDLRSATGEILPRTSIRCDVTGYVETKVVPLHGSPLEVPMELIASLETYSRDPAVLAV